MLLSDAIAFTFEHRESWKSGSGRKTAGVNSRHALRILGDIPVEDIETKHFSLLTRTLLDEGKSKATVNRVTSALSTVITELRENGVKLDAPVYKHQREPKGRLEFYTQEQLDQILEAAFMCRDHYLMFDSVMFAVKTGCRQGEMLGLEAKDVDFEAKTITFRDVKTAESTGVKDHVIHLHPDLEEVLERRLELRTGTRLFEWRDRQQLLRAFRQVLKAAGVDPKMTWHHLRHTVATQLVAKKVPLKVIMGVLNHSSIDTTLRYAKAMDSSIAEAIDLL